MKIRFVSLLASGLLILLSGAASSSANLPAVALASPRGPVSVTPSIARIYGDDRYETSAKVADQYWTSTSTSHVVIATGENYPDALSAAPLAKAWDAPILLTERGALPEPVIREIQKLKPTHAFIIGSTSAVATFVEVQLKNRLGVRVVGRVSGADRYQTASAVADSVAKKVGKTSTAVVVSGTDYPDALAVGAFAAGQHYPILLTAPAYMPAATSRRLTSLHVSDLVVVGGTNVVADKVFQVSGVSRIPRLRLAGTDRYGTSVAVARRALRDGFAGRRIYVATGTSYPDGLTAGPLAAEYSGLVCLTAPRSLPSTTEAFLSERARAGGLEQIGVLGGPSAVSPSVFDLIKAITGAQQASASRDWLDCASGLLRRSRGQVVRRSEKSSLPQ